VLVIDGLSARYLGPYGNTWIETPAMNRLAANSLLAEQSYADSPDLATVYRSYWTGIHAAGPQAPPRPSPETVREQHSAGRVWLPEWLASKGISATLLTDDLEVAEHPGANLFDQRIVSADHDANPEPAADITTTRIARLFALAIDFLERTSAPFFLWVHAKGMRAAWDAPLSFREQFLGEDDPPTTLDTSPAVGYSAKGFDPDELLPQTYAYAGQIALLDLCLDSYLDAVAGAAERGPLCHLFTSPRGYPLGEHGVIGIEDAGLYEELLHTPLLAQFPERLGAGQRTQALIQPADLFATLLSFLNSPLAPPREERPGVRGESILPLAVDERSPWRRHALSISASGEKSVRTRYWSIRRANAQAPVELFLKPDDRCDANEIASRLPQVASDMTALLDESFQAASEDRPLNDAAVSKDLFESPKL
jgi:arylsulfatase A-like enzyme